MGIDATKPVEADSLVFKRIHVRGEEDVDLEQSLQNDSRTALARIIGR
jgi:2,5-furandicarboxylate decarboxylase 1